MKKNATTTPPADLVSQLVYPGSRVLYLGRVGPIRERLRATTSLDERMTPTVEKPVYDAVVAVDWFLGFSDDDQYDRALDNVFGVLAPGGVLVVYERNPYDDVDDNPEGSLARGIVPIHEHIAVSNTYVLGQEFFGYFCAGFYTRDYVPRGDDEAMVPRAILRDREPDGTAAIDGSGERYPILGWMRRQNVAVLRTG